MTCSNLYIDLALTTDVLLYSIIKVGQSKATYIPKYSSEHIQLTFHTAILYKSLGIGSTTILALAGVYGTVALSANLITTVFLTDQWGRRK